VRSARRREAAALPHRALEIPSRIGFQRTMGSVMALRRLLLACVLLAMSLYTAAYFQVSSFQKWSNAGRVWNIRIFASQLQWLAFAPAALLEMGMWRLRGEDFVFLYYPPAPPLPAPAPGAAGGQPPPL
jgi:hypothetical protein